MENTYNLSLKTKEANKHLGKSIKSINRDALIIARESKFEKNYFLGVKDTSNIPRELLKRICSNDEFIWHTLDTMSDRGRAIDTNLINPITGRLMTGSSSGSAINVLYGINHIGIGTDGGGSIIYPSMSLNLYSFMGKGMGLVGSSSNISTDGIEFSAGIGFMSHDLYSIKKILQRLDLLKDTKNKLSVSKGSLVEIENKILKEKVALLVKEEEIKDLDLSFSDDREKLMNSLKDIFQETDILIVYERDIDSYEYGDSVMGTLGIDARIKQKKSNKVFGKVANMLNLTAITIPDTRSSSGIIILAKQGLNYGSRAFEIAEKLSGNYMPDLYYRYFKNSSLTKINDITFKL